MADRLEDSFARFEVSATPLFQPAPLDTLRRRRRLPWAAMLAGALALLAGAPVTALTMAGSSPSTEQPGRISENRLGIPGWEYLERPQLGFAAGVTWAHADGPGSSELARSTDLGRTWTVTPSDAGDLFVSARGTVFVREPGVAAWERTEAGSSWQRAELPGPPQLLLENDGDLVLECPGAPTYGGPSGLDCDAPRLISLTSIEPPAVPAGMGRLTQVVRDGRGRTWLLGRDVEARKYVLTSSPDEGRTWGPVAEYQTADPAQVRITASPVDGDVFVVLAGPIRVSAVTLDAEGRAVVESGGTEFRARRSGDVRAIGGGGLACITAEGGVAFFNRSGSMLEFGPDVRVDSVDVLTDGTAVFRNADGTDYWIGVGTGLDRALERLQP